MSLLEASVSIGPESKHYKMKQLVNAIQLYFQTKREDTATIINIHLQTFSYITDLSVFDPHSNIAPQFFVSLYELMNKMEVRSSFAWNCVDVLANICRNPMARQALIHTYQFIPSLSRLLSDTLSPEKQIKLLRLMQDLTCGIKISWQIPHLPHLMVTLSQWIGSSDDEIITLSMGILVNLCYKNLPAVYTLMGNVDVQKILKICSAMRGPTIELYTCKLLIILDHNNGHIPDSILKKVVDVAFESVIEAFRIRDSILLRQIVEFFLDVGQHNSLQFLIHKQSYEKQVNTLLETIQNNHSMETGDSNFENRDPECIALVFEFLNHFVMIKLEATRKKFPLLIEIALKWIHTDLVSSQALRLLKSVAVNVDKGDNAILEPLVQGLPIFLTTINTSRNEDGPDYIEQNLKIAGLLQLLKIMAQVPSVRPKILQDLNVGTVCKVFGSLQDVVDASATAPNNELDMGNIETINLYIHGIALVNELAKHEAVWTNLQTNIMQHKQTHMILAQCLCQSPKEEKSLVLEMSSIPCFPHRMVAEIMISLQAINTPDVKQATQNAQDLAFPVLSVTQIQKINSLLAKLSETFAREQFGSVLTSDVIELYEYKLASMGNAERAAMTSVEAASERCTYLQHRNAQLTAELNRSHQLLYHVQQCREQEIKEKDEVSENLDCLSKQLEAEKSKFINVTRELKAREGELKECMAEIDDCQKKYEKLQESKKQMEENNAKLKQLVAKLEENSAKFEKNVQKKDEIIKKNLYENERLKSKIVELETDLSKTQEELQQKRVELSEVVKELSTKKQILDTITKFALNSQQKAEQ